MNVGLDRDEVQKAFPEFELVKELGRGGNKVAFLVRQAESQLVLKILLVPLPATDETTEQQELGLERVRRELEGMRQIDSPRIARIVFGPDTREIEGEQHLWYVEPYYPGGTLDQRLGDAWPPWQVASLIRDLVAAVDVLWTEGKLVHRDIKPGNVVYGEDDRIVVLDLGSALWVEQTSITQPVALAPLTPTHAAPEQFEVRRGEKLDFRTDLFLIGIIGFWALTGKHPFSPEEAGFEYRILEARYDRQILDDCDAPDGLKKVLKRLLARRPNGRYRTTAQVIAALNEAMI